jgi:hypothetical protein
MHAQSSDATFKVVALVRDKDGNVKYDDPMNVPNQIYDALPDEDRQALLELQHTILNIGKVV